ncbi:MAG: hypothetical protein ACRDO1_09060 [Nocardioidaceae bacterium]
MGTSTGALKVAAVGLAISSSLHNADHFRRGTDSVSTELLWAGYAGMAWTIVTVVLILVGHRWAPVVAVAAGLPLAVGFAAAHWLPTWSVFSDSFVEGGASVVSQAASLAEIAGALGVAAAGVFALRTERAPLPDHRTVG